MEHLNPELKRPRKHRLAVDSHQNAEAPRSLAGCTQRVAAVAHVERRAARSSAYVNRLTAGAFNTLGAAAVATCSDPASRICSASHPQRRCSVPL
eukprot:2901908-Pleurochrysis_carterae.AAC.1